MDEALAWAKRSPNPMPGKSEIEIRPFYEAADLAEFLTTKERSTPREGERGKLGVALYRRRAPACVTCGLGRKCGVTETHQAIEATFRIERAWLIAGLARIVVRP